MRSFVEPDAFGLIFDRHYDAIFRFVERRVGGAAAQDIASEVFVIAFRSRQRFVSESGAARPWLYGIASRKVLHEHRRFARQQRAYGRVPGETSRDRADDVVDRLDAEASAAMLLDALDRIDPMARELLLMVAWDGLSYAEAAVALDIPIGTVRSRLHRARKVLAVAAGVRDEESEVVG